MPKINQLRETPVIIERIRKTILPGTVIPKPEAKSAFIVKNWGRRRGEEALVYLIPNHVNPGKPREKGIALSEFRRAYDELQRAEKLTRTWFNNNLVACSKEGGCNFTTIGGIFQLLGVAKYSGRGVYLK